MAERYYTAASGNWSETANWDGGVSLPGANDDVYANGNTIAINQDITVLSLRTTAGTTAVAGGGFTSNGTGTRTVNANIVAGTTTCITVTGNNVNLIVNGNVTGGSAANARGLFINPGISSGSCTITGSVTGGANATAYGLSTVGPSNTINGDIIASVAAAFFGAVKLVLNGNIVFSSLGVAPFASSSVARKLKVSPTASVTVTVAGNDGSGGVGALRTLRTAPTNSVAPSCAPSTGTVSDTFTFSAGTWTGSPTSYETSVSVDGGAYSVIDTSADGNPAKTGTQLGGPGTIATRVRAENAGGWSGYVAGTTLTVTSGGAMPTNLVPASVTPASGTPATSFAFNAGTWTGTAGYPITYTWVYRKSGSQTWLALSTSQNPTIPGTVFPAPATYDTQVTATNTFGSTTINGPSVTIGTTKPAAVNPLGYFGL